MKNSILLLFVLVSASYGQNPAVVRVEVKENSLNALGSGTLIGKSKDRAWVLTNAHVIDRRSELPIVVFPYDNTSFTATVVKQGNPSKVDLALLAIRPPKIEPIRLAKKIDTSVKLTIVGFGSNVYKEQTGNFDRFLQDCFMISVVPRQGDSGGPVLNESGELVGCLFGSSEISPHTLATQVEIIREFLKSTEYSR